METKGQHIVRIHLPARPVVDRKHVASPPSPGPQPLDRHTLPVDEVAGPPLSERAVNRVDAARMVVVGAVPALDTQAGHSAWWNWKTHALALATGITCGLAAWAAVAARHEDDQASAPLIAGSVGLATGYALKCVPMMVSDAAAWLRERRIARHLAPSQQLERVIELANAQPLTRSGLTAAIQRIRDLHAINPVSITGEAVAQAIARLAEGALELVPGDGQSGFSARGALLFRTLTTALAQWRDQGHLDAVTHAQAILGLGRALGHRAGELTEPMRHLLPTILVSNITGWPGPRTTGLSEAQQTAFLVEIGDLEGLATPAGHLGLWTILTGDLEGNAQEQVDQLIDRLRHAQFVQPWLRDRAVGYIAERLPAVRDADTYAAYVRALIQLTATVPGFDPKGTELGLWINTAMWPLSARSIPGAAQTLIATLPQMVDALGARMDKGHLFGLIGAMHASDYFGTRPGPQLAATHLAALARPAMAPALRQLLRESITAQLGVPVPAALDA